MVETVLRARWVAPMDQPPLAEGAVVIRDGGFVEVGRWQDVRAHVVGEVTDLGEVVVLPGLVNAHAHLDYTGMGGHLPPPKDFADWIKGMLALKAAWSYTEYAASWVRGARMLLRHGTTLVADMEAVPELLPDVWSATPLQVISCLELTGVRSGRDPEELVREATEWMDRLPTGRCRAGLSPHAPYSTSPGLLRLAAEVSWERHCLLTTHVAESRAEFDMFNGATGPLYDWLKWNGRDMSDCGGATPVGHLARLGYLSSRLAAVHVNYLGAGDAEILGRHGVHVVHCPRSHDYFRHASFPLAELREAGVNVALGTDSLVSVRQTRLEPAELDMFDEMRCLVAAQPGVRPGVVVEMGTLGGAKALGLEGRVGRLGKGAWADLVVVPVAPSLEGLYESVIEHRGPLEQVMVAGDWIQIPEVDPPGRGQSSGEAREAGFGGDRGGEDRAAGDGDL